MDYCLYKLKFDGAVHFGQSESALSLYTAADHFRADTLFSALCHTVLALWGEEGLREIVEQAESDELRLSDSMPWRGKQYYLPKPCAVSEQKREVPAQLRKAIKKLAWIPVSDMDLFERSIRGEALYTPGDAAFGMVVERASAAVVEGADAESYQIGAFRFFPECGLYVLAGVKTMDQAEKLHTLLSALGMSGIGGKVSSGYGSFTVTETHVLSQTTDEQLKWLNAALNASGAKHQLLLTTSLPTDAELDDVLENAQYQLVRRAGYVQSETFAASPVRKRTQYFLAAGAMLERPFRGALYTVAENGGHPVLRYAKPMTLGVAF